MLEIGATCVRSYENTPLDEAIEKVTSIIYDEISRYRNLEPLRMEFGKEDPLSLFSPFWLQRG